MASPPKKTSTPPVVRPKTLPSQNLRKDNLEKRPPLDSETISRLRFSGIIFAAAAIGIFFVAISFALSGSFFMAMLVLAPSILMAGFSWQCFIRIL